MNFSNNVFTFFLISAGVGRTGVFITLSIVLERMQYEGVVDVFQSVRALRTQRPAMVQVKKKKKKKSFLQVSLSGSVFPYLFNSEKFYCGYWC